MKSFYQIQMSALRKDFIPSDQEMSKIVEYMLLRDISNIPYGALVAYWADLAGNKIPIKAKYWFIRSMLYDYKYIKGVANPVKHDPTINAICDYYECSPKVAKEYLEILSDKDIEYILDCYKEGLSSLS